MSLIERRLSKFWRLWGGFGGFWKDHAREKDNTPKFKKKPRPFQQTSKLTLIIDGIVLIGQV